MARERDVARCCRDRRGAMARERDVARCCGDRRGGAAVAGAARQRPAVVLRAAARRGAAALADRHRVDDARDALVGVRAAALQAAGGGRAAVVREPVVLGRLPAPRRQRLGARPPRLRRHAPLDHRALRR